MTITKSAENYLETILVLKNRNGVVRSIEIATKLGFSKPSVSIAMKNLRKNGYISVNEKGYISLEPSGREIAKKCMKGIHFYLDGLSSLESPPKLL